MRRRDFLAAFLALPAVSRAQEPNTGIPDKDSPDPVPGVIIRGSQGPLPDNYTVCPLGHASIKRPNTPLPIHNGDSYFPNVGWSPTWKLIRCQICGVLFAEEEQP